MSTFTIAFLTRAIREEEKRIQIVKVKLKLLPLADDLIIYGGSINDSNKKLKIIHEYSSDQL